MRIMAAGVIRLHRTRFLVRRGKCLNQRWYIDSFYPTAIRRRGGAESGSGFFRRRVTLHLRVRLAAIERNPPPSIRRGVYHADHHDCGRPVREHSWLLHTYNEPFSAWGDVLHLADVPRLPWAEPIGMFLLAIVTTVAFWACGRAKGEKQPFSAKWTALLYFNGQVLPGWAWAAYTGRWEFFGLCTVLLGVLAALTFRAGFAAAKENVVEAS
jgi:hypothetical protein